MTFVWRIIMGLLMINQLIGITTLSGQVGKLLDNGQLYFNKYPSWENRTIQMDADGFLWIACRADGFKRFDGSQFKNFDPSHISGVANATKELWDLQIDTIRDIIWLITKQEVLEYHMSTNAIVTSRIYDQHPTLKSDYPLMIAEHKNALWITFESNSIMTISPADEVKVIVEPEDFPTATASLKLNVDVFFISSQQEQALVFGTHGLITYDLVTRDKEIQFLSSSEDPYLRNIQFRNLIPISDDEILLGTWGSGLIKYHIQTKTFDTYLSKKYATSINNVRNLNRLDESTILVNLYKTIYKYSPTDSLQKTSFLPEKQMGFHHIFNDAFIIDGLGSLKKTTLYQNQWQHYLIPDSIRAENGVIMEAFRHAEDLFMAVYDGKGIYRFNLETKHWKVFPVPEFFLDPTGIFMVKDMLLLDDHKILCITPRRVLLLDMLTETYEQLHIEAATANRKFNCVEKDGVGNFWIGTRGHGVIKFDSLFNERAWYVAEFDPNGSPDYKAWFTYLQMDSNGKLWVRNEDGYSTIDPTSEEIKNFVFKEEHFETFDHISHFLEDQDYMWSVGKGLAKIDKVTHEIVQVRDRSYSEYNIDYGRACTYDSTSLVLFADQQIFFYDHDQDTMIEIPRQTGYQKATLWGPLLVYKEEVWVSHQDGFSVFNPKTIRIHPKPAKPYFKDVRINNMAVDDYVPFSGKRLKFPKGTRLISLGFAAIDYESPGTLEYTYSINDQEPVTLLDESKILLSDLNVGWHHIKLSCRHKQGVTSPFYEVVSFRITPYWYQTMTLKISLFCLLCALLLTYDRHHRRMNRKVRMQEERAMLLELRMLRAQMKPHFIFNCLNTIDGLILSQDPMEASHLLAKFSKLIRQSLELTRERLITVQTELDFIGKYLEVEKVRLNGALTFDLDIQYPKVAAQTLIAPFIIHPYIENAVKHGLNPDSGRNHIVVSDQNCNLYYCILIQDYGSGILATKRRKEYVSLGGKITKERIQHLNQAYGSDLSVDIANWKNEDGATSGTIVEIRIPKILTRRK